MDQCGRVAKAAHGMTSNALHFSNMKPSSLAAWLATFCCNMHSHYSGTVLIKGVLTFSKIKYYMHILVK